MILWSQIVTRVLTVEEGQLVDYDGDYSYFLEKNEDEAERMEELEAKKKAIEQDNITAKSKVLVPLARCCVGFTVVVDGPPCPVLTAARLSACLQLSKAEKLQAKKEKAKAFHGSKKKGSAEKNSKRWT